MNQNGIPNIVQELLETLFTTLIANQHLKKNIVGSRKIKYSGWVAREIELLRLLEPQNWEQYFNLATVTALVEPILKQLLQK